MKQQQQKKKGVSGAVAFIWWLYEVIFLAGGLPRKANSGLQGAVIIQAWPAKYPVCNWRVDDVVGKYFDESRFQIKPKNLPAPFVWFLKKKHLLVSPCVGIGL